MQAECCVCLKTYASAVLLNNHLRIVHRNNNMWNNSLQNYATYFASNYLTDERVKKWAAPYREGAVVNCNMGLERFHLLLKDDYLRFRQNKRIDELADLLIKYSTDSFRKDKHLLRGSTTGRYRLQISHANHKSAEKKLQEGGRVEKQANGSFTVFSSATSSGRNVTFFELCSCLEQNRCRLCRVCHHNMSCDCSNVKAGVPCIHMHMTAMEHPHLLNASGAQEEAQKSTAVQARTKSQELEEAENSENLVEEEPKDDFEKKLRTLLIDAEQALSTNFSRNCVSQEMITLSAALEAFLNRVKQPVHLISREEVGAGRPPRPTPQRILRLQKRSDLRRAKKD